MIADAYRVQGSAFISTTFHSLIFGMYILMKTNQSQDQLLITRVELLDIQPEASAPSAQQAPRGLKDFLRMALPTFQESAPQEAQLQQEPLESKLQSPELSAAPSLRIDDNRALKRQAQLPLKASPAGKSSESAFTDLSAKASLTPTLADVDDKPAISLEAVGRSAPRSSAASIRINPNASVPRRAGTLADIAQVGSGGSKALAEARPAGGIQLREGSGLRRTQAAGIPSIGYSQGGAISLKERPVARSGGMGLPGSQASTPASSVEKLQPKLDSRNKSVEISGPLAQRKIVAMPLPNYPEWAKDRGIEAEVVIRFFVSMDGKVRDRMILERTSGYKELDLLSMDALKKWIFAPLPSGSEEADQWGIITFRFRLK